MAVHSAPRQHTSAGLVGVALSLFAMLAVQPAQAVDAVEYFRGKTIKIYVGYGPGGGNDITARVFAEFFSKHVPGSPKVVVENMPGGGALKAARFVADSQPDGLRILDLVSGLTMRELFGEDLAGFSSDKVASLGGFEAREDSYQMIFVHREFARSWQEATAKAQKEGRRLKDGSSGVGNSSSLVTEWLSRIGQPVQVVYGYGGTAERYAAFNRRETDLNPMESNDFRVVNSFPNWLQRPSPIIPVLATRDIPPADWVAKNITPFGWEVPPHVFEVLKVTETQKQALVTAYTVRNAADRAVVPKRVPENVLQILRQAFKATGSDPAFIAAMEKRGFKGGYRAPEELDSAFNQLIKAKNNKPELYNLVKGMYLAEGSAGAQTTK
jgi:tripartite-type tricarboxylate transporter receptor subunit TctC